MGDGRVKHDVCPDDALRPARARHCDDALRRPVDPRRGDASHQSHDSAQPEPPAFIDLLRRVHLAHTLQAHALPDTSRRLPRPRKGTKAGRTLEHGGSRDEGGENPSVLHELQLQRTPRRCQHLPPPERVWVPHAADQQRAGTQVRFVPPPRLGLRAGRIQLLLLLLRRLHLHRNAGGERASTEASGAPRHTRAPKTARHLPKASRTLTPSLLGRMVSIGSHLPQPTPSTSNC
eukprot:scaffold62298_cov45-Phaeocystis_antarctica.AAC.1